MPNETEMRKVVCEPCGDRGWDSSGSSPCQSCGGDAATPDGRRALLGRQGKRRYCGMCDSWTNRRECRECGAPTDKAEV